MNELAKNIQEQAESLIKKTMERAERIREREFMLAKEKQQEVLFKEKAKIDNQIKAKRNSLKAQMILEFRLKEENFKDSLAQNLLLEVRQEMASLDRDILANSLKNLIREAVLNLDLKNVHILVNKRDEAILKEHYDEVISSIRKNVNDFKDVSIEGSLNALGGAVVKADSSGEFFDNTFERRFERFDEEFKEKILEMLG